MAPTWGTLPLVDERDLLSDAEAGAGKASCSGVSRNGIAVGVEVRAVGRLFVGSGDVLYSGEARSWPICRSLSVLPTGVMMMIILLWVAGVYRAVGG